MNKETILKQVSERDLWKKYLGHVDIGKMYSSPFRRDTNPSFGLFRSKDGKILFHDFGGETGDIFRFIELKHGIRFKDALLLIESDFRLSNSNYRPKTHNHLYSFADKIVKKEPAKFEYILQTWDNKTLGYWAQFGITPEVLFEYNVFPVKIVKGETWRKAIEFLIDNPIFCYKYPSGNIRFYRPFAKDGILKHFGNANGEDIFGYEQLYRAVHERKAPETRIIITAGQKDALSILSNNKIRTVSLNSESAILSKEQYLKLLSLSESIEVCYDADKTGRNNTRKLQKEYGLNDYSEMFTFRDKEKDVSDYFLRMRNELQLNKTTV